MGKRAIIMSCGTALASLAQIGVKPNFHIEMERTQTMQDFINYGTDASFRKGITLLCLHTVSPSTIELFESSCIAIKPNDTASHIIKNALSPRKPQLLAYCNPTVANAGLSFAVAMGFRKIHLVGIDFGVGKQGEHHSKESTHYILEKRNKDKSSFKYNYKDKRNIVVEGNFGGEVQSHHVLNMARVAMERYLALIKPKIKNIEVINSNFGAKIQSTTTLEPAELPEYPEIDESRIVKTIYDRFFSLNKNGKTKIPKTDELLRYFFSIEEKLKISDDIKDEEALFSELHRIYALISAEIDLTTHMLLRGSLNTFFSILMEHCAYLKEEETFFRCLRYGRNNYNTFIDNAFNKMRDSAEKLDNTRSELFRGLTYDQ